MLTYEYRQIISKVYMIISAFYIPKPIALLAGFFAV